MGRVQGLSSRTTRLAGLGEPPTTMCPENDHTYRLPYASGFVKRKLRRGWPDAPALPHRATPDRKTGDDETSPPGTSSPGVIWALSSIKEFTVDSRQLTVNGQDILLFYCEL